MAEYAAPVWSRSLTGPELNQACRVITRCPKPATVEELYLLSGMAPPNIRRDVCVGMERTKQMNKSTRPVWSHTCRKLPEIQKLHPIEDTPRLLLSYQKLCMTDDTVNLHENLAKRSRENMGVL